MNCSVGDWHGDSDLVSMNDASRRTTVDANYQSGSDKGGTVVRIKTESQDAPLGIHPGGHCESDQPDLKMNVGEALNVNNDIVNRKNASRRTEMEKNSQLWMLRGEHTGRVITESGETSQPVVANHCDISLSRNGESRSFSSGDRTCVTSQSLVHGIAKPNCQMQSGSYDKGPRATTEGQDRSQTYCFEGEGLGDSNNIATQRSCVGSNCQIRGARDDSNANIDCERDMPSLPMPHGPQYFHRGMPQNPAILAALQHSAMGNAETSYMSFLQQYKEYMKYLTAPNISYGIHPTSHGQLPSKECNLQDCNRNNSKVHVEFLPQIGSRPYAHSRDVSYMQAVSAAMFPVFSHPSNQQFEGARKSLPSGDFSVGTDRNYMPVVSSCIDNTCNNKHSRSASPETVSDASLISESLEENAHSEGIDENMCARNSNSDSLSRARQNKKSRKRKPIKTYRSSEYDKDHLELPVDKCHHEQPETSSSAEIESRSVGICSHLKSTQMTSHQQFYSRDEDGTSNTLPDIDQYQSSSSSSGQICWGTQKMRYSCPKCKSNFRAEYILCDHIIKKHIRYRYSRLSASSSVNSVPALDTSVVGYFPTSGFERFHVSRQSTREPEDYAVEVEVKDTNNTHQGYDPQDTQRQSIVPLDMSDTPHFSTDGMEQCHGNQQSSAELDRSAMVVDRNNIDSPQGGHPQQAQRQSLGPLAMSDTANCPIGGTEVNHQTESDAMVLDAITSNSSHRYDSQSQSAVPDDDNDMFCDICEQSVPSTGLHSHIILHTTVQEPRCQECGKLFAHFSSLKLHMRTHTGVKPYTCSVCDKSFTQAQSLRNHLRIHTDEKPFQCDDCGRFFRDTKTLFIHRRIHTDERPYNCHICDKAFRQSASLKTHLRSHSGKRPYVCSECGCAFVELKTLQNHKLLHSDERTHQCHLCPKAFKQRAGLLCHLKTHDDAKTFVCNICGNAFKLASTLKNHMNLHSTEKLFQCTFCPKAFKQRAGLCCHLKLHCKGLP